MPVHFRIRRICVLGSAPPPLANQSPAERRPCLGQAEAIRDAHRVDTSAVWHVCYGDMNTDEGFYAVATRGVAHGKVPYRDFGFTQPPLVFYANSLPLRGIGFGLFAQRALNVLWAAIVLFIAARWLASRTQFRGALCWC